MNLRAGLRLYAITDSRLLRQGQTLEGQVAAALRGGATMVQLREKFLEDDALRQLALRVKAVTDAFGVPLILNDRADLAAELGAAGAHLGPDDGDLREARTRLDRAGPGRILGATARTVERALAAEAAGADYLGCGAVFGTSTKADASLMPLSLLREICAAVRLPVVAIGGIDRTNLPSLLNQRGPQGKALRDSVAGVAVASGIFAAEDVEAAARELTGVLHMTSAPPLNVDS
ncbi:MAG: thiamine phosphate synthase [Oscillospiraceae bacterium]|nr:thiamine phosphate synthase [Oscillospiraceae bacterium]